MLTPLELITDSPQPIHAELCTVYRAGGIRKVLPYTPSQGVYPLLWFCSFKYSAGSRAMFDVLVAD